MICGVVSVSLYPDRNLHTVHNTTHRLLRTSATTTSAEHHTQQYTTYVLLKMGI
jgi:hypothetical protein